MFSATRQGSTIYVLEKGGEAPVLRVGQAVSVSNPTPRYSTATPGVGIGMNTEMVVDIRVKADEVEYDFKQLPCTQNIATYSNAVVSDNREAMLAEVDSLRQNSMGILDKVDYHRAVVDACDEMLKTLNPSYAKEQARDEAISNLSERLDSFEQRMGKALGNIEKLLAKNGKV